MNDKSYSQYLAGMINESELLEEPVVRYLPLMEDFHPATLNRLRTYWNHPDTHQQPFDKVVRTTRKILAKDPLNPEVWSPPPNSQDLLAQQRAGIAKNIKDVRKIGRNASGVTHIPGLYMNSRGNATAGVMHTMRSQPTLVRKATPPSEIKQAVKTFPKLSLYNTGGSKKVDTKKGISMLAHEVGHMIHHEDLKKLPIKARNKVFTNLVNPRSAYKHEVRAWKNAKQLLHHPDLVNAAKKVKRGALTGYALAAVKKAL